MRDIEITTECLDFVENQDEKTNLKFYRLFEVITEIKIVNSNFVKKLQDTHFYELRIKTGSQYRIIIFAIDHLNFNECTKAVCLFGFQKKGTKDYKKAIKKAEIILEDYLKEK